MKKYGYRQSNVDHTLFLKKRKGKLTTLIIYVDDMIITRDDSEEINRIQEQLNSEFEMKNLGELKYFLGIEVARSCEVIFISQRKYVLNLLSEVGLLDCKLATTPIPQNLKVVETNDPIPANREKYQRLVGKPIYLSHIRPDVTYTVNVVSQHMKNPREEHMEVVTRILRYLKSSLGGGLIYSKNNHLEVEGYSDSNWVGTKPDRKSTIGYVTLVGGNLVTWRSKKQKKVTRSSTEAKWRGMANGICKLLWLRRLLTELGYKPKSSMKLHYDNQSTIELSKNPIQHEQMKHVDVDRNFINIT
ncbi:uncharacterized protein LOC109798521 [Cajanus cajan]|uniref:Reverse transcriptase Ty1/copia-type domain-containing protein n=1 Tax=Cajanus cajan TaxID=3821 RepID=A0A151TLS9_CAJCA|nr:uncharacterized protein LOC109798521 [Cajanus cajan]KYP67995.1 hypothetical protein KK1_021612 [Cajanus cajan]